MSQKHKAVKATLDTGTAAEWNDDHLEDFETNIDMLICFRGAAVTACWDLFSAGTGNDPAVTLVGAAGSAHAFVVFNTGATTNNTSGMSKELAGAAGNITSAADYPLLTFTMQIDTVHNAGEVIEMGLFDQGVAPFTANQDGAYFLVNDDTLYAVTGDGAAETITNLGAYSEYSQYRIQFVSVGGTDHVKFYVDDMVTAAADHTANLPDSNLTIMFTIRSLNNVDSTMPAGPLPAEVEVFKINILSTPSRARVYVDGTYTHHLTPSNEKELSDVLNLFTPGSHLIRVEKAGKAAEKTVEISEGYNDPIYFTLQVVGLPRSKEDLLAQIQGYETILATLKAELETL